MEITFQLANSNLPIDDSGTLIVPIPHNPTNKQSNNIICNIGDLIAN